MLCIAAVMILTLPEQQPPDSGAGPRSSDLRNVDLDSTFSLQAQEKVRKSPGCFSPELLGV